ncbi:hypothetical protein K431DRAFT_252307, partial [Polychaeton citri CBS 116435]
MPMPTGSFLLGIAVLAYLCTFIVFAVLRIVTGVSIQRVGYSGFRRIAFSPRHGLKINIRGVGLSIHWPTFALPTWCSLVITELHVIIDSNAIAEAKRQRSHSRSFANGHVATPKKSEQKQSQGAEGHGKLWKRLTDIKEKIKRLHSQIRWIRLVDLVVNEATFTVVGVGTLKVERTTVSVDTRTKTVDRSRLFQHYKAKPESQTPAEWKTMFRSILFTPDGRDSNEILDYCALNIHGLVHRELQGLRDASISLKLGRLNIPWDDIEHAKNRAATLRGDDFNKSTESSAFVERALNEIDRAEKRNDEIVRTISDSREFVASVLRGIQEIQLAVSFFGLSKRMNVKSTIEKDVYFNLAMKEVGLDVLRLDRKSPAHRMYFSPKDVAHQALLTAIAISAGFDDGHSHPERVVYVPMVTATVRTTLPSKTIQVSYQNDARERNTNMLYANLVCTSPSVDVDPKHLPLVIEILNRRSKTREARHAKRTGRQELISRLLPKANIKLGIQEPVLRVSLPPMDKANAKEGDYDLLISSVSTMSLDIESSHSPGGHLQYGLASHYRHANHQLYYQTAAGDRHDLLNSDTVEIKVDINALPEPTVFVTGNFRTFALFLVRPDICEGVHQIVKQLRKTVLARRGSIGGKKLSFLRRMPVWLQHCTLEGTDFGIELAGIDEQVSTDTRGFGLHLQTWTTEYKAQREEVPDLLARRRSVSIGTSFKHKALKTPPDSPRARPQSFADGRRLTFHVQDLEGLIIDSIEKSEPESFLSMPRFEVAFSTNTDAHGPLFHINSHAKSLLLNYSLYNHFAMGVAIMVIKKTFISASEEGAATVIRQAASQSHLSVPLSPLNPHEELAAKEVTTVDFKANLVQIKAMMPSDPPMMLQIFGIETGQHRWAKPFVRCRLTRIYVRLPTLKSVWTRIVTVKTLRVDIRELKRKVGGHITSERSVDLATEHIRINVPHSLVVHDIFDNITNVIKTTKQLQHHFATGTDEYILAKAPEGPKNIPKLTIRTQVFVFEIEDSSFEWKLGAIYRAGLLEQKQRLARDEAFRLKAKRLARCQRVNSRRARSAHPDGRRSRSLSRQDNPDKPRSRSTQPAVEANGANDNTTHRRRPRERHHMRYDTEGRCGISDISQLTIDQAKEKLEILNSQTWKHRIDRVYAFQNRTLRDIRKAFWGPTNVPEENEQNEPIMAINDRPGLFVILMSDLHIAVDKPSFPVEKYADFLHDIGKGMPRDMKYGLLLPMHLSITTGETRIQLRDYPLPLLHIPALANGQSPRLPSMSLKTDFVVAEEFRDIESQRNVNVMVVPPDKMGNGSKNGFAIDVRRTISPVKTYSNPQFEINSSLPTRITWGTSYQPAIQDTMQVIEGFTKPPLDPSERVGFWDKIRLSFHSRVNVAWKGDGDVHFVLKGSRDPYIVTGQGAGLVMVWRGDVRWNIASHEDPRRFMIVDSGEYMLAIPDFNKFARHSPEHEGRDESSSNSSAGKSASFKKVVMKLSGNVRWNAGLCFQRELSDGSRTFDFKPHYDVVLKHPDFAKAPPNEEYDGFRGFRSHHIHMSIAIAAPHDRDWSVSNLKPSNNYNSVHLTPRFFSHFYNWWSMFSGVMSLPVRQGPLFGVTQKKSKKFGRHLATIKYNLLLSPLFIGHVYKHKDAEDYQADTVSATGLKMRLDSFMLDLHQRREHFDIKGHGGEGQSKRSSGMRINQAQLDFIHADLRALSATIAGTTATEIEHASDEVLASLHSHVPQVDMSRFTIPDNDFSWIDMDDFVELDWILPAESNPETKILPLAYAPRFTYFRRTDHGDSISGDKTRSSTFGDEPTHYCVMSTKNDPRRVQAELVQKRLNMLKEQKAENMRAIGDQELKVIQSLKSDAAAQKRLDDLHEQGDRLQRKEDFLQSMLETLVHRVDSDDRSFVPDLETNESFTDTHHDVKKQAPEMAGLDAAPLADYTSDFNNRFVVHNPQIKWNNSLRNIILRYIHQVSQRRGFVYYMSRRAVKFILDILEEQRQAAEHGSTPTRAKSYSTQESVVSPDTDDEQTIQDRIEQILRDGRDFVKADEPNIDHDTAESVAEGPSDDLAVEYTPLNTYHFRLIAPQIQLQSEKNQKQAVLVTAKGMQLKVVQIMDKDRVNDEVSGLVQRRFSAVMDSVQMFVSSAKTFSTEYLHLYSGNRYGTKPGTYWPPWVPMEVMFEFQVNPYGFHRVVHRTSASLRYDKHNTLRLKYNDDVSGSDVKKAQSREREEYRVDHVWVEFPHFRAICDSSQYYALYIIVMDLLLYSEPLEKTRSERLEKIMLASDFSDLTGAPEMVQALQERIRQLEEIKMHFQVNEKFLDRQGWKDRISMDQDLASCEDELFFMMKAITTAQQRLEDRREQENATGVLRLNMAAKEIAWHLVRDSDESLVELQLKNASFDRTDNNDGSNYNCIEIGRINGFNLLPDAIYPEIIAPYVDEARGYQSLGSNKMLRVQWLMLEAIAGIPVVDYFEIDLVPLKLQVEREVAKKLFEYIFPGVGGNAFEGGAGSLDRRLRPTLQLPKPKKGKHDHKNPGAPHASPGIHGLGIFQSSDKDKPSSLLPGRNATSRRALAASNGASSITRTPSERSLSTLKSGIGSQDNDKHKGLSIHRSGSQDRRKSKGKENEPSDDLTQMMNRASNYMTLAFVKIPSMVLCLSYKGQGRRNIEDVHDLVFTMPTLEYRNKTWSNLDLALQLKKDVVRALISHAGTIIGNKFSHHKPNRQTLSKLRQLANDSTVVSSNSQIASEASSVTDFSPSLSSPDKPGRPSTASNRPSTLARTM